MGGSPLGPTFKLMIFITVIVLQILARVLINPQRTREGYSTHLFVCVCMCVCVTYDSGGYADLQR